MNHTEICTLSDDGQFIPLPQNAIILGKDFPVYKILVHMLEDRCSQLDIEKATYEEENGYTWVSWQDQNHKRKGYLLHQKQEDIIKEFSYIMERLEEAHMNDG